MKAKLFRLVPVLLFLIIVTGLVNAQSQNSNTYILANISESIDLKEKGYYILKINDLRVNKSNLGSITLASGKIPIQTPDSLPAYLLNVFKSNIQADSGLSALVINIEKLKSLAYSNGKIDEADLYIKANFQIKDGEYTKTVHSFEKTFNYKKQNTPDFLTSLIYTALSKSLAQLPDRKTAIKNPDKVDLSFVSQSSSDSEILSNMLDTISLRSKGYFIERIVDIRNNKKNLGFITVKSIKKSILTSDSLPVYILKTFRTNTFADSGLKPLVITIEKFKIFANTNGNIDEAELYMKINAKTQNGPVYNFEKTFAYQKKSRPDFLNSIIFQSLTTSLKNIPSLAKNSLGMVSSGLNNNKNQRTYNIPFRSKVNYSLPEHSIRTIQDDRIDKQNEGDIYKGAFNQRTAARLDSGLVDYIGKMIIIDSYENKKPLNLYVSEFKCTENLTPSGEEAKLTFTASLVKDSLGSKFETFKQTIEIDTFTSNDVTVLWPEIIEKGLLKYFTIFKESSLKAVLYKAPKSPSPYLIITKGGLNKKYFQGENKLMSVKDFRTALGNDSPEIQRRFKNYKGYLISSQITSIVAGGTFGYYIVGFLISEEKSLKKWYNEPAPAQGYFISRKTDINLGLLFAATSIVLKLISNENLKQAIKLKNNYLTNNVSLNINPGLNGGCTFGLGLLLSKAQ